jgi:hypothetical protein
VSNRRLIISGGSGSSGLFAYRSDNGSFAVSVLVYPKAWPYDFVEGPVTGKPNLSRKKPDDGKVFPNANTNEQQAFTILLREGKKVGFELGASAVPAVQALIAAMNERRKVWRLEKKQELARRSGQQLASEDDSEESDLELATETGTTLPVECSLQFRLDGSVAPAPGSDGSVALAPGSDGDAESYLTPAIRDLAWLCLRAAQIRSAASDGLGDESAGQLLDAARAADEIDPLALLAELDFVHEMHRLQHRIRKGYVPEEDRLAAIRGRITDRGVLDYEMTGIPLLECRFDEFVEATPLFRVLATALDVVSAGSLRSSLGVETDGLFGSGSEVHPTTMREQLRSIPSLPLPVARATADRLRLTRLQQEWQRPLELARRILRAESVETGEATREGSMTVWTVDTAKVWEKVLERAFQAAGVTVSTQQGMNPPWQGLGAERRPDLTVTHEDQTYLLDAKYKLGTPGSSTADQYQMFAYSLINEVRPDAVALVYPVPEGVALAKQHGTSFERETTNLEAAGKRATLPKLLLLQAPFPAPSQAQEEGEWQKYLISVGTRLKIALEQASTPPRVG